MKQLLILIRLPNLLIIAATMLLIRYAIIEPIFIQYGIGLEFPNLHFGMLVLSVVLIAAAGYMINDYFDVKIDSINKPDKVVVNTYFKAKSVFSTYLILNGIALILSFYISLNVGIPALFFIFPVTIGMLWFYSTTYKQQLLIGNILVSLLIAVVPILVALFEMPSIHLKYHDYPAAYKILLNVIFAWCEVFAIFAFLVNLIRELIKDAQDYEGDNVFGRNTLPIVIGIKSTKIVINILILVTILLLFYIFTSYLQTTNLGRFDWLTLLYFGFLLVIPMGITGGIVLLAKEKKLYSIASTIIKLVMVAGILYSLVARFKLT
jgi:4-hydroxybenzoate polyprenyltransferase